MTSFVDIFLIEISPKYILIIYFFIEAVDVGTKKKTPTIYFIKKKVEKIYYKTLNLLVHSKII